MTATRRPIGVKSVVAHGGKWLDEYLRHLLDKMMAHFIHIANEAVCESTSTDGIPPRVIEGRKTSRADIVDSPKRREKKRKDQMNASSCTQPPISSDSKTLVLNSLVQASIPVVNHGQPAEMRRSQHPLSGITADSRKPPTAPACDAADSRPWMVSVESPTPSALAYCRAS
jgi:hypothetical protein